MTIRVSEYAGPPITAHSALAAAPNVSGFIRTQSLTPAASTGSTGNGLTLSSGTYLIGIDSDATALVAFGSSVSTGPTMTSTLAQKIPANIAPIFFYTKPYAQLFISST